ncbi:hypothetical protein C9374_003407 [Naegleria lovaniensis]|uniref:Uncharacterized protein n=1 Tax=Naegleria lovaniensis TaxID=51637 RepID=A0AA88GRA8_NAELO|nr:uncharacterized protein C9374_003407 [Naegleria lovaniensis]KAG2385592.1 hypothetical protein C9374_003407 [Naegleria lovaniensis]
MPTQRNPQSTNEKHSSPDGRLNNYYEFIKTELLNDDDSEVIEAINRLKDRISFRENDMLKIQKDNMMMDRATFLPNKEQSSEESTHTEDDMKEYYERAFREYLEMGGMDEISAMLSEYNINKEDKTNSKHARKEIKTIKSNLSKAQKTYRSLQSILNHQLNYNVATNHNNFRLDKETTIRNDIRQHPILMKVLSNEIEKFKVYINRMRRLLHEKADLEKMSRSQKSETTSVTNTGAFKFDNIPPLYRKQFFEYLTNYVLRDQKNLLLLQQALNAYYSQTHLHGESSVTSMNDMFNNKSFWEYFISTYFIQNEYLKLLLRKYQRRDIRTENDIILRGTMGNLYHPEQVMTSRTLTSDTDVINIRNLMYNINLTKENNQVSKNQSQSKDQQPPISMEAFNKFVSKWKQDYSSSRYRELYKLVDDIYSKLETKLDRYNTMFHHDTLRFLSKRQKILKEETNNRVCTMLIQLVYQNYIEGKQDMTYLKQALKARLHQELIANAMNTLQFLQNNSLERLVVKILNFNTTAQQPKRKTEELFPVPIVSPLLVNYSNENLKMMIIKENNELLTPQAKPILQRKHLRQCIDEMLREHLTHSLRFADPFIFDIHKNLHKQQ